MRRLFALLALAAACSPSEEAAPDAGSPPAAIVDGEVRAVLVAGATPIAGARFELAGSPVFVASSAGGAVVLRGVPAGRWTFRATAVNAALSLTRTLAAGSGGLAKGIDLGRLALEPFGTVHGRVLRDGAPVAGARVVLMGLAAADAPEGSYAFATVAPGTYELRAIVGDTVSAPVVALVSGDTTVDVELAALPTFTQAKVSGVVAANGAVELSLVDTGGVRHLENPGDDGHFQQAGIPAGLYLVRARTAAVQAVMPFVALGGDVDVGNLWLPDGECGPGDDPDLDGVDDATEPPACRCDPSGTLDTDGDGLCDDVDPFIAPGALDAGTDAGSDANDAGTDPGDAGSEAVDAGTADAGSPDAGPVGPVDVSPAGAWGLCAPSGWCWEHPLPTGDMIWGVTGTSDDELWMMVGQTTLVHWNGTRLFRVPTPLEAAGEATAAIFARTPADAWLVGRDGTVARWNGITWNTVATFEAPTDNYYSYDVWAPDASNAWIVAGGRIWHWTGTQLEEEVNPSGQILSGVHGTSAQNVWISGWNVILQRDGGAWTVRADAPAVAVNTEVLWGVYTAGAHAFFAGARGAPATDGLVLHWDGTAWTRTQTGAGVLGSATGTAPDDVWFGDLHWNGTAFERRTPLGPLQSFVAFAKDDAVAVGWPGAIERWVGDRWEAVTGGLPEFDLESVWASSATDAWGTGSTYFEHWDGQRWAVAFNAGETPPNVWGAAANDVWAGLWHYDGSRWAKRAPPAGFGTAAPTVRGRAGNDVWLTHSQAITHWNGTAFEAAPSLPSTASVPLFTEATSWNARGNLWIVNAGGVFEWDGQAWTRQAPALSEPVVTGWGATPGDLWLCGTSGRLFRWTGGAAWTEVAKPLGSDTFRSMWGAGADEVYATDWTYLSHWDGQQWTLVVGATPPLRFKVVAGSGPGDAWVAGSQALHLAAGGWKSVFEHVNADDQVRGVFVFDDGDGWAAGNHDLVLRRSPADSEWKPVPAPQGNWFGAFGAAHDDVWLVGSPPFAHWTGASFTAVDLAQGPSGADYYAVWGAATNDVWAVGDYGAIQHWNGSVWGVRNTGYAGSSDFTAIDGLGANDVWIGGYQAVEHWNGTNWVPEGIDPVLAGQYLRSISVIRDGTGVTGFAAGDKDILLFRFVDGSGGTHWVDSHFPNTGANVGGFTYPESINSVLVVGPTEAWLATEGRGAHFLYRWDGQNWTPSTFPSGNPPKRLGKTASGQVYAVGNEGAVFRLVR